MKNALFSSNLNLNHFIQSIKRYCEHLNISCDLNQDEWLYLQELVNDAKNYHTKQSPEIPKNGIPDIGVEPTRALLRLAWFDCRTFR